MVITTAELQSTKPGLRLSAGSSPARGVSKIQDGEDLWQCSRLEIRLNAFRQSTVTPNKIIHHHQMKNLQEIFNSIYGSEVIKVLPSL